MILKSALTILAVTSTASSLSIQRCHINHVAPRTTSTALHLEVRGSDDDPLEGLSSRRDELKRASMSASQASLPMQGEDIEDMGDDELQSYLASIGDGDMDVEAIMSGKLSFKTKRGASPQRTVPASTPADEEGEKGEEFNYVDHEGSKLNDENSFHIVNRIGFTTADWADPAKGFVNGKLKKADRKMGKYNKSDLKKVYNMLEKSGVTFIESSSTFGKSDALLSKINKNVELFYGPDIAYTFPNPWKQALRNRSRPQGGSDAICTAAEAACKRLGAESLALFQVENPWYYIGGTKALARGMLEVIQEGHALNVGCIDMSISKMYKIQKFLQAEGEMLATNQFEFSLTNRKNGDMIEACKKLGITPICRNVLDGGLASGRFTPTTPTGGRVSDGDSGAKGPYSLRKLEKLNALFQTMESLTQVVGKRIKSDLNAIDKEQRPDINSKITTTQIAINYVKAKGAVPLLSITNPREAKELLGCLGWDLNEDEVDELDKACQVCGL